MPDRIPTPLLIPPPHLPDPRRSVESAGHRSALSRSPARPRMPASGGACPARCRLQLTDRIRRGGTTPGQPSRPLRNLRADRPDGGRWCTRHGHAAETLRRQSKFSLTRFPQIPIAWRASSAKPKFMAALNHPNIAQIYGLERSSGQTTALGMELVEGPTSGRSHLRGPIPIDEACPSRVRSARRSKGLTSKESSIAISSPPMSRCARTARQSA
jgi:hypothetical protein